MNILKSKAFWIVFTIIALVLAFLAVAPKPIDMNLDKVGKGLKSVVFIYDPNLGISNQQSAEINKARELIGEQATFLIAQIGDPNSENFRRGYQAQAAELLFFSEQGDLFDRRVALVGARELAAMLSE